MCIRDRYKDVFAKDGVLGFAPCFKMAALMTVSYTHLDVYKRQQLQFPCDSITQ